MDSHDAIVLDQEADTDINWVLQLLKRNGAKPTWDEVAATSSVTKVLWNQWQGLLVHEGELYRKFERHDGRPAVLQLVVPYKIRRNIFILVHEGVTGGHLGWKRTDMQLQEPAYWPGWSRDVRRFIRMCSPCAQNHARWFKNGCI